MASEYDLQVGMKLDMSKVAALGGRARAQKLSQEERAEISRKGGLAARGRPRKPYKRKKKKKKSKRSGARSHPQA